MPIDATEKRMLDAIDGRRSIGEIASEILPSLRDKSQQDPALVFFERLWLYDQVVFDSSQ